MFEIFDEETRSIVQESMRRLLILSATIVDNMIDPVVNLITIHTTCSGRAVTSREIKSVFKYNKPLISTPTRQHRLRSSIKSDLCHG